MKFRRNDIAPVSIEKLALGGRGVGFTKDATFFVQDSVPGDEVEARVTFHKKRYAEAELGKIIKPSPDRIAPRCKHFGSCGGCSWQMLPYEKQLFWKEKQVRETLQHVGGFADPVVLPMIGCEGFAQGPWFYRNKMEWSFDPGETGDVRAGFHLRGRWHDVVQVEECFLQSGESVEIFKVLRGFFAERARVAREKGTDPLVPGSMTVREGKRTQEMMVVISSPHKKLLSHEEAKNLLEQLSAFPRIVSVVHVQTGVCFPSPETIFSGNGFYREEMVIQGPKSEVPLQFEVRAQAFFQPNPLMAEKMYGEVLRCSDVSANDVVMDLFCGTGTIGIALARFCGRVIGIDSEAAAITSARKNAELNELSNIEFHQGFVQDVLPSISAKPSVIVLDPPRAGLAPKALEQVIHLKAAKIVYVSCNPASFARDAKFLCDAGYSLRQVQPFDQFPHTAHIELVASFVLK